jgi:hypothetical protein
MTVIQGTTDNSHIRFCSEQDDKSDVPLSSLASMTGFSEELIKDELLLASDSSDISISDLRAKMLIYLKKNFNA